MTVANKPKVGWDTIAFLGMVTIAVVLRLWDLDRTSLWFDEAASWAQANRSFAGMLKATSLDNYPPLYNILLWMQIRLFGDSEASLRFPGAVTSILAVVALYGLGRTVWDAKTGLVASLLLTLHPLHVFQAQDARMYSLLGLTATCFAWSTVCFLKRATVRNAVVAGFTALMLLYTHIYGVFVFASINLFVIYTIIRKGSRCRAKLGKWLVFQIAAVLAFSPWLLILVDRTRDVVNTGFWIQYPDIAYLWKISRGLFSTVLLLVAIALTGLLGARALINHKTIGARFTKWYAGQQVWGPPFLLAWLLGPVTIAYLLSVTVQPIIVTKYLLCVLPAFLLLLARGLVTLFKSRNWVNAVCVCVLLGMLPFAVRAAAVLQRADWRTGTRIHQENLSLDDETIFYHSWAIEAYRYYGGPIKPIQSPGSVAEAVQTVDTQGRLWIIFSHTDKHEREAIIDAYTDAGFELEREWNPRGLRLLLLSR